MSENNIRKIVSNAQYGGGPRSSNYGYYLMSGYHGADTKRNVWEAVGYPDQVDFDDQYNLQDRLGLAKAVIMLPPTYTWSKPPNVFDQPIEDEHGNLIERDPTEFEQAVNVLVKKYKLWQRLKGMDWRQRVGRYGGITIGAREPNGEGKSPSDPLEASGLESLVRLSPVLESQIDVTESSTINDFNSESFGHPEYYNYRSNVTGDINAIENAQFQLDPTRVYVYGEGADDGSIYGIPALQNVFNSLLSWEKLVAAMAEGSYKNAKHRTVLNINDERTAGAMAKDSQAKDDLNESIDEFEAGFNSMMLLAGVEAKTLQTALTDPSGTAGLILQDVSAGSGIEKTVLVGFETGERSSQENMSGWLSKMNTRRENEGTDMVTGFLQHLVDVGILPQPKDEILVVWEDLLSVSDEQKLDNAGKMADINKKSFDAGGSTIFFEDEIRETAGYEPAQFEEDRTGEDPVDEE